MFRFCASRRVSLIHDSMTLGLISLDLTSLTVPLRALLNLFFSFTSASSADFSSLAVMLTLPFLPWKAPFLFFGGEPYSPCVFRFFLSFRETMEMSRKPLNGDWLLVFTIFGSWKTLPWNGFSDSCLGRETSVSLSRKLFNSASYGPKLPIPTVAGVSKAL